MRESLAAIATVGAIVAGCGQVHAQGGRTVSRSYQVSNFRAIEVAGPYNVKVRTGPHVSVSARGSEQLLEHTVVEVQGDRLLIRPVQQRSWFPVGWSSRGKAEFTVTVPQLNRAAIAGSGDIQVEQVRGNAFEGAVVGSGDLRVAALDVQSLKLSIAGSGGVKALNGQAKSAKYDVAGSGDIDASAVTANDAQVSIAGSGSVRARASGSADVSIMGSGDVLVTGGAKCNVRKAGSGNVRCS